MEFPISIYNVDRKRPLQLPVSILNQHRECWEMLDSKGERKLMCKY